MKKFTKYMLIAAALCFVVGAISIMAATAMGGNLTRRHQQNHGRAAERIVIEATEDNTVSADSNAVPGKAEKAAGPMIGTGRFAEGEQQGSLEIQVQAGKIQVVQEEELESVEVRALSQHMNFVQREKGDSVELIFSKKKGIHHWLDNDAVHAVVVIPSDHQFERIDLELDAGAILAEDIHAEGMSIDIDAGAMECQNAEAEKVDISCSAGSVKFEGDAGSQLNVEVDAGQVEVRLLGEKTDYNYRMDVDAGKIEIDGESYSGMDRETRLQHEQAAGEISLECDAGKISLEFEQ